MSRILKSVIQDIINDNTESAQVSMHSYIVAKTQEVSGLTEGAARKFIIFKNEDEDERDGKDDEGEFFIFPIYVVEPSEMKGMDIKSWDFIDALESGAIGKKSGTGKVYTKGEEDGENVKGPVGVTVLFHYF